VSIPVQDALPLFSLSLVSEKFWLPAASSRGAVLPCAGAAMPGTGCPDEPVLCVQVMGWVMVWLGSANSC